MKYQNKKGFVLLETLVVTIFTLIIFTLLYTNVVPLLGRYDTLSYYNDLDTTYDLYYLKKMLLADSNYESISNLDYQNITCGSLNDIETCQEYFQALNINPPNGDELIYLDLSNDDVKNNSSLSDDVKDYLRYVDVKEKILLLKRDDYISYLELAIKTFKDKIIESINNPSDSSCKTKVEEDGIIYISGTKDCINFNYVWYSGKLWRITAIYPDGTMKMITDDEVTSISYGSDVNFYTDSQNKSYVYQWLNEDFLDTLYNYENIIVTDSKWNSLTTEDMTTKITEGAEGVTTTTSPVGLLNSYEYYMSYKNTSYLSSYLNIDYYYWLLNPYSTSYVWNVNISGYGSNFSPSDADGVRPSINLKSGIQLSGGAGTKTDPYTIVGDKEEVTAGTTLLNTRISGEYVKFHNELYRIVSIENNITKINKNDYVRDISDDVLLKLFSTSVTYGGGTTDDYWGYYLNNTWYNELDSTSQNMIVKSTYYIGTTDNNYKKAICSTASNTVTTKNCKKTSSTWTGKVGLPRYGEMFSSQQVSGSSTSWCMWLMNPYSTSLVWFVNGLGDSYIFMPSSDFTYAARPSINLKSSIKITGGKGTKENPFEISL